MIKTVKNIFICFGFASMFCYGIPAWGGGTIDKVTSGDYTVSGQDDYVRITKIGILNGSITNSDKNNPGHIDIVDYKATDGTYSTKRQLAHGGYETKIGTSDSYLEYVLVSGNTTSLTIANDVYANNIFLENSTVNIDYSDNANINSFQIHNGDKEKKLGSTININVDYDKNTSFGSWQTTLDKNLSIENINIADEKTLTLKNSAFADNINLVGEKSKVIIENTADSVVRGTISGKGTVEINKDYNQSDTHFGTSDTSVANLQVNSGNTLTLEASEGYKNNAYIDNLTLQSNSGLTLGQNSKLEGTISGGGTVTIATNYSDKDDSGKKVVTNFGKKTTVKKDNGEDEVTISYLSNISINGSGSLSLNGEAYVNNIAVDESGSLALNSGSSVSGVITGKGKADLNTTYTLDHNMFGNETTALANLNINGSNTLTLNGGTSYVNNLNLSTTGSTLTINGDAAVTGTIKGNGANGLGIVNLNRTYNTNDYSTTFGIKNQSINTLNIGNSGRLLLYNTAYVDKLNVSDGSNLNIFNNAGGSGGVNGAVVGGGSVFISGNYSTSSKNINNYYNTSFGTEGTKLNYLSISNGELTLGNAAYVDRINLTNNSTLILEENSNISGTIYGAGNNTTVNVNSAFNGNGLGVYYNNMTYFGTSNSKISNVNINEGGSLSLTTNSYINSIKINSAATVDTKGPSLALKAYDLSSITLNNANGIQYDDTNNIAVLITLNNEYIEQLYNLSQRLNSNSLLEDMTISNNNLYLDILSKTDNLEGSKFFIDSTNYGSDFFSNAGLVYETIFKDLKLETEYNTTNGNTDLYLVVKMDRTPTLKDVSESTITSSFVVDGWKFLDRTENENTLVYNLTNISNKKDFFHALTNISPDVSGLNVKIPAQSIISAVGNIDKRLAYFRMLKFDSRTNNYNMKNLSRSEIKYYDDYFTKPYFENNAWMEAFAGTLHQDTKDNIFGYDADYYGGTFGYDVRVNSEFIFGLSYTFNLINSNDLDYVKSDRDKIDAMTNNLDLYFMFYNKWNYLALNVGGGYNMYKQERKINFYNFNKTAKADYDGYSYYGGVEYGFNILLFNSTKSLNKNNDSRLRVVNENTDKVDKVRDVNKKFETYAIGPVNNFIMLTPKVSLTYNNIMIDDYTEKGADAANLIIKTKDYESLDLNAGLSLTFSKAITNTTSFQTILNGYASYGIINNKVELDARYIDDDKTFKVYGFEPNDLTYNAGINFNLNFYDKIDLGLSYNYMFGDGVEGMMGRITFLWAF